MKVQYFSFDELSTHLLYEILQLRSEVFVVEQDCVYQDLDDLDLKAFHCCLFDDDNKLAAYTRLLPQGLSYKKYTSIGRVVSSGKHRKKGLGKTIMKMSIEWLKENYTDVDIKISAQCYLQQFYEDLNFVSTDEFYLEDGIPHMAMVLKNKIGAK